MVCSGVKSLGTYLEFFVTKIKILDHLRRNLEGIGERNNLRQI